MKLAVLLLILAAALPAQTKVAVERYVLYNRSHLALTMELKPDPPTARRLKGSIVLACPAMEHTAKFEQTSIDETWIHVSKITPELPAMADCQATVQAEGFPPAVLKFTTRPELRFEKEIVKGNFGLRVLLRGNYPVNMRKSADYEVFEVTLKKDGGTVTCASPLFGCTRVPDTRLVSLQVSESDPPPDKAGLVAVYFAGDRLTRRDPVLFIRNIVSVLDEDLILKEPATYEFPSAPKGKDQAYAYIGVTHQAGPRVKPGTALDAKFDPLLFRTKRFLHGPSLTADLLWNTIPNLKSNDRVKAGWRGERFFRFLPKNPEDPKAKEPLLPGVRLAPSAYFETNRLRTQRNFIADFSSILFFRGLYNPQAIRTRRAYLKEAQKAGDKPLPPEAVKTELLGWAWSFEPGLEAGSALDDLEVKASDKSGKIPVPSYGIFRLKSRTSLMLELWRLALEVSAEFRYLAETENVFRETSIDVLSSAGLPAKRTVLSVEKMTGIKPAFDVKLRYRIDPLGHYQLETGFKNGALPPGYVYANFYRTGLVVQF